MLVGNKNDLEEKRRVSLDDGLKLSKEIGCNFMEVSSKDFHLVSKLFETFLRDFYRIRMKNDPQAKLEKKRKKGFLEMRLLKRPSKQDLINKNILSDDHTTEEK